MKGTLQCYMNRGANKRADNLEVSTKYKQETFWPRWDQSRYKYLFKAHLTLCSQPRLCLTSGIFSSGFLTKFLYRPLMSSTLLFYLIPCQLYKFYLSLYLKHWKPNVYLNINKQFKAPHFEILHIIFALSQCTQRTYLPWQIQLCPESYSNP